MMAAVPLLGLALMMLEPAPVPLGMSPSDVSVTLPLPALNCPIVTPLAVAVRNAFPPLWATLLIVPLVKPLSVAALNSSAPVVPEEGAPIAPPVVARKRFWALMFAVLSCTGVTMAAEALPLAIRVVRAVAPLLTMLVVLFGSTTLWPLTVARNRSALLAPFIVKFVLSVRSPLTLTRASWLPTPMRLPLAPVTVERFNPPALRTRMPIFPSEPVCARANVPPYSTSRSDWYSAVGVAVEADSISLAVSFVFAFPPITPPAVRLMLFPALMTVELLPSPRIFAEVVIVMLFVAERFVAVMFLPAFRLILVAWVAPGPAIVSVGRRLMPPPTPFKSGSA